MDTDHKTIKNNNMDESLIVSGANQATLVFSVEKQAEQDSIEMGVLENGVPYLTGRGLERMCGVGHGPFHRLYTDWDQEKLRPRGKAISQLLQEHGYTEKSLFLRATQNGREIFIFTEPVCMALLEYYALYAPETRNQAKTAYRTLARTKFREFVYQAVGYQPKHQHIDSWKHFHDRVDLTQNAVPIGYFSVFREIASMIVPMINSGVMVSDKVVPDISVGKVWSVYWSDNNFNHKYGERTKFSHEYPDYYPQAKSNPQMAYAYPDSALGEFRVWLRKNYIASKLPKYLLGQSKNGAVPIDAANNAIELLSSPNS